MNEQLLQQLLGSVDATANAPVDPGAADYGQEFFAMSPPARLETLKLRKSKNKGQLDPTGEALLSLLSRRVAREQSLTSADRQVAPSTEDSLLQSLQGMDPLSPLRNQQYQ